MGHLVDYKNPQQWLRVAKEVIHRSPKGSVHFVWLGAGPLYKECVESLDEEQKRYIHFLGHCADPRRNLAEASVYFQPSLLESHGLAVVEAMSNGVPCVVSRAGGLPESVSDGYDGFLVDLGDDSVIAEKILCLLNDEKLRREMGGRARQTSLKKFSMDVWRSKMKVEFEGLR
jgi:glycosyltransferase involved in cell wall biosynthesis